MVALADEVLVMVVSVVGTEETVSRMNDMMLRYEQIFLLRNKLTRYGSRRSSGCCLHYCEQRRMKNRDRVSLHYLQFSTTTVATIVAAPTKKRVVATNVIIRIRLKSNAHLRWYD